MDELGAPSGHNSALWPTRPLLDVTGNGVLGASLSLRAVGISGLQGLKWHVKSPSLGAVADEALPPVPARVPIQRLVSDPGVTAAYAEGQRWTRDPRGSQVRSDSPRIPHGKVTKWLSPIKIPCQEAIITGQQRASTPLSRTPDNPGSTRLNA